MISKGEQLREFARNGFKLDLYKYSNNFALGSTLKPNTTLFIQYRIGGGIGTNAGVGTITLRTGSDTGTIVESFNVASSNLITISAGTLTVNPTNNLEIARYNHINVSRYEFSNIDVSQVLLYNRALTENEVKQNFNALRGRYNI